MIKFARRIALIFASLILLAILTISGFRIAAALRETSDVATLMPKNGQLVPTSFGDVHVSSWGPKTGTPILMTHGMGAWGGLWVATAEELAARGYRVIALDQAPFGFSARDNIDFSRKAQAARIREVLDGLGISRVVLVGHSYGGGVTLETALRYPDKVSGLVLVCPVTGLSNSGTSTASAGSIPLPLRSQFLADFLVASTVTNPLLTKTLMKQFMFQKDKMTDAHIAILQKPLTRAGNTRAMTMWLQQFLAGEPDALSAQRGAVKQIKVRSELIWGDKDTVTPIAQGDDLAQLIPFGDYQKLTDIGHMPQIENPAVFNTALLGALERLTQPSQAGWTLRPSITALADLN